MKRKDHNEAKVEAERSVRRFIVQVRNDGKLGLILSRGMTRSYYGLIGISLISNDVEHFSCAYLPSIYHLW